jgi:exopolyphosphatase/guanosine-5'-triphosphate,3'-diphosphate pyrophosphatase
MGAVRLAEKYFLPHPPESANIQLAITSIWQDLDSVKFGCDDCKLYAVAGTPTTLAAISLGLKDYDREKVHLYKLSKNKINQLVDLLFKTSLNDIIEKFGVNPMRADVISAGGLILKLIMEKLEKDSVIVSANGLRFGLIKSVFKNIS